MDEPAEDGMGHDANASGQAVAVGMQRDGEPVAGLGKAGAEAGVGTGAVVVAPPLLEKAPEVAFAEGNEEVEALPAEGADESLAVGVGQRRLAWSAQHSDAQGCDAQIELS